mgnify:CR=1 FL=1
MELRKKIEKLNYQILRLKLERDEWRKAAGDFEGSRDKWRKLYEETLSIAVQKDERAS